MKKVNLNGITSQFNVITKPEHYTQGSIEVWDFIVDQNLNYLEGNVIKYVCRHKHKNGLEDLKKAKAYINKLIDGYSDDTSSN